MNNKIHKPENHENSADFDAYLQPGKLVDSDHPVIIAYAKEHGSGGIDDRDTVLKLFYAIRDGIRYDPYVNMLDIDSYRASTTIERGYGFCVPKAAVLAACLRVLGIPARVGYADVKNHLTSEKLYEEMGTDLFAWHSYADVYLDGAWIKCTPAFNLTLCEKAGIKPLDFDGYTESLFHEFDVSGRRHMEYIQERGTFADVPFERIEADFRELYPSLAAKSDKIEGDFSEEVLKS